jgi:peptidoglycan hydrolase-like protein with peptidoglycan-binding domain
LPAGTTLRGYELKSILGKGAFGITYRALDTTLHRDVAIKEYLPTSLALREGRTTVLPISTDHAEQFAWGRERFLDEARTLARLDRTPAIVRVLDFLEANGTAYMVMALIEGETLNKRLTREKRLAPDAIERLVFPLLDGLEEVHAIGFLHRDIKPANIMLDDRGRPTLIDFGASRAAMAERSTTLTAIFTPGYAATEQFTSVNLGPWSDIYGLAATLYHAITGQIPPSAIQRILQDAYQPLGELQPPGYPPALLAGIDAGLAVRAEDRPRSIAEWRHMLRSEEWLSSHETTRVARKPGRLARAASRSRQARVTVRGPALLSAAAAAILVLAGAGWLVYQANAPGTLGTAALSLSAEQLEQALAERRKADALAAEKRRLEDEARQKAAAETEAKRQAEAELEQARQARQKAEDELATLKADIAARRQSGADPQGQAEAAKQRTADENARGKAEAETAALRQAEEEAGKRAAADAEAKRQADEALARAEAERQRADADARAKAEAETAARRQTEDEAQRKAAADAASKRQADEAQAKAQAEREKADAEAKAKSEAETAERGLRLESADRQRLQVALTSLGFDTRSSDGVLGSRTREMIAGWQKKAGAPATGFLTAAQRQALLKEAAAALSKYDEQKKAEEQKKLEDDKKKSDAAQAGVTPASPSPPTQTAPALATASPPSAFDGTYTSNKPAATGQTSFTLAVTNGRGSLTMSKAGCNVAPMAVTISPTGEINGQGDLGCPLAVLSGGQELMLGRVTVRGRTSGGNATLTLSSSRGEFPMTLNRGASPPAAAAPSQPNAAAAAAAGPSAPPDGLWRGTYSCLESNISSNTFSQRDPQFTASLNMQLTNGSGSWKSAGPTSSNGYTQEIRVSVGPTESTVTRIHVGQSYMGGNQAGLSGQYDGNAIRASDREKGTGRYCTFVLTRA